MTGRRDVDRLFEVRADQRVGFVEDREHLERAVAQQAFDRDLLSGDVLLDQQRAVDHVADALCGGAHAVGIVGADHAATGGQPDWLHDRGQPDGRKQGVGDLLGRRDRREAGLGHPSGGERAAHRGLVAGSGDRGGGVVGEAEALRGGGRDDQTRIVDRDHRVDR